VISSVATWSFSLATGSSTDVIMFAVAANGTLVLVSRLTLDRGSTEDAPAAAPPVEIVMGTLEDMAGAEDTAAGPDVGSADRPPAAIWDCTDGLGNGVDVAIGKPDEGGAFESSGCDSADGEEVRTGGTPTGGGGSGLKEVFGSGRTVFLACGAPGEA